MAATSDAVRFAIFDWLDESGRGQGDTYEVPAAIPAALVSHVER